MSKNLCAQSNTKYIDLVSYFRYIENQHPVVFSYADDKIKNIRIKFSNETKTLKAHLLYLEKQTPFEYLLQNDNSILVVPKPNKNVVCVSVFNEMTNEVLPNSILKYNSYLFKSNAKGQFEIPVSSKIISFKIFSKDFISQEFTLDTSKKQDCYKLYISPFYQALDEVVLTNLLTRGVQKIASGGLEINYKEFGLLPGLVEPDVLQSLQALPGIISRRESVSYLNVRGGTHDQNLFLWDGIKMYNTSHFFGMISAFNPYMTEKVSLIKNGTSAQFGDGVSSLINMKTSNVIADSLKAEVGSNLINVDAIVELPLSKSSSVQVSSRQSINSLWESPTYDQYFDKIFQNTQVTNFESPNIQQDDDFNFFDATLNYKHQLTDRDFLKVNLFYAEDEFSLNRFETENTQVNIRRSNLEQTNFASGIFYERNWSKTTTSQFQFYTSIYNLNADNTDLLNQQRLEQINEVRETGFKINVKTQLTSNFEIENGYQLNETGILNSQEINNPGFFSETENSILTNSLYSQLHYRSDNSLLNLSLGGRLNHFTKFDELLIEPRFNLSYEFLNDLFLEILGEQKSQVTSQSIDLQTDFLGVENRRWVLSDPDSRPIIESQQISAGFNFIKPSWFINLDFYYKEVDGITTQGQGFQNQFEFTETHGSYEVKGFDVLVNKNFDPFSGWVSYSWSENDYDFEALSPSSFPNNLDIKHVISTGLSYEKNGLKLSTGFNWHSGVTTTLPSENQSELPQQIQFEDPNAERLKDYFRFDFSTTYSFKLFKNVKALAGLSFLNILDNSNAYNQFYSIGENQNIHVFRQNGLGFTPNVMFRLRF
ncbi:TonB-dependent receptor plug domain-containing protein [Flavobacteriaceae bacterium 14752]|uniref:TonB-dependent receptor plug domain-containing protein n=1 Tax=Mesohalobacter salilacus TaxID=2491711 RepID=UPI000F62C290|nr:TonB-dependent receptor [Flavobacteriaceae bacterium 14752]